LEIVSKIHESPTEIGKTKKCNPRKTKSMQILKVGKRTYSKLIAIVCRSLEAIA